MKGERPQRFDCSNADTRGHQSVDNAFSQTGGKSRGETVPDNLLNQTFANSNRPVTARCEMTSRVSLKNRSYRDDRHRVRRGAESGVPLQKSHNQLSTIARGLTAVTSDTRFAASRTILRARSSSGPRISVSANPHKVRPVDDFIAQGLELRPAFCRLGDVGKKPVHLRNDLPGFLCVVSGYRFARQCLQPDRPISVFAMRPNSRTIRTSKARAATAVIDNATQPAHSARAKELPDKLVEPKSDRQGYQYTHG